MRDVQRSDTCAFAALECLVRDTLPLTCVCCIVLSQHTTITFTGLCLHQIFLEMLRVVCCPGERSGRSPLSLTVVGVLCLVIPVGGGSRKTIQQQALKNNKFHTAIHAKIGRAAQGLLMQAVHSFNN